MKLVIKKEINIKKEIKKKTKNFSSELHGLNYEHLHPVWIVEVRILFGCGQSLGHIIFWSWSGFCASPLLEKREGRGRADKEPSFMIAYLKSWYLKAKNGNSDLSGMWFGLTLSLCVDSVLTYFFTCTEVCVSYLETGSSIKDVDSVYLPPPHSVFFWYAFLLKFPHQSLSK